MKMMSELYRKRPVRSGIVVVMLSLSLGAFSCEKIVSIDLNNAAPQLVIEGVVTDQSGPYAVTLSKTGDYFTPSLTFPPVAHALVVISDNTGNVDTLREDTSGTYVSSSLKGVPGRTYALKVIADGKEYDAESAMPQKVMIDSLYAVPFREFDGDRGYYVYVDFRDPPSPGNYYRLDAFTATLPSDSITGRQFLLYSDKLTNGNEANYRIRVSRNARYGNNLLGDTLTVRLLTIDKATYDYFNTLNDVLQSDRSPTSLSPANPNTNLDNGALGYFAAYTVDTRTIVFQ